MFRKIYRAISGQKNNFGLFILIQFRTYFNRAPIPKPLTLASHIVNVNKINQTVLCQDQDLILLSIDSNKFYSNFRFKDPPPRVIHAPKLDINFDFALKFILKKKRHCKKYFENYFKYRSFILWVMKLVKEKMGNKGLFCLSSCQMNLKLIRLICVCHTHDYSTF